MKRAAVFACVLLVAPLTASASEPSEPAYRLHLEIDLPLLAIAASLISPWFLENQLGSPFCAPQCDPSTVNAFDRPFAGRYSPGWTDAGNVSAALALVGAPMLLLFFEGPGHTLNDTVVLLESVLFSNALAVMANYATRRPRPFMYGTGAPADERVGANGELSFFSGHTAASFAAATSTFFTLGRLGASPRTRWILFGSHLALASFVAISRVAAGGHFPTDVIAGAAVGSAMGTIVPALHDRGVAIVPSATEGGGGLLLVGRF